MKTDEWLACARPPVSGSHKTTSLATDLIKTTLRISTKLAHIIVEPTSRASTAVTLLGYTIIIILLLSLTFHPLQYCSCYPSEDRSNEYMWYRYCKTNKHPVRSSSWLIVCMYRSVGEYSHSEQSISFHDCLVFTRRDQFVQLTCWVSWSSWFDRLAQTASWNVPVLYTADQR